MSNEYMVEYISETIVVFNEKIKLFIEEIKCNVDISNLTIFGNLDSVSPLGIMESQKNIREYIYKNQHKIDLKPTEKNNRNKILQHFVSCPDYFAIIICILCDFTLCYSFTDVLNQLQFHRTNPNLWTTDIDVPEMLICACSHFCRAERMFILRNDWTPYTLFIGCDCVEKTKIISPEELKELKKKPNGPKNSVKRKEKENKIKEEDDKEKKKQEKNEEKEREKFKKHYEKKLKKKLFAELITKCMLRNTRKIQEEEKKRKKIEDQKKEEEEKKRMTEFLIIEEKIKNKRLEDQRIKEEKKLKEIKEEYERKVCYICRTYHKDGSFGYNGIRMTISDVVFLKENSVCFKCLCVKCPKFRELV